MSNLARKYQHQTYTPQQPKPVIKKVKKHAKITTGEKMLALVVMVFIAIMSVQIISVQADIYNVNKDIEDVKREIQIQQTANRELEMQVSDLSKYEIIWEKAKGLGMSLDENNVRVVEGE